MAKFLQKDLTTDTDSKEKQKRIEQNYHKQRNWISPSKTSREEKADGFAMNFTTYLNEKELISTLHELFKTERRREYSSSLYMALTYLKCKQPGISKTI